MVWEGTKKFSDFVDACGMKQAEIAVVLGARQGTISMWCQGTRRPGVTYRAAIERWTGGAVRSEDWASAEEREAIARVAPAAAPVAAAAPQSSPEALADTEPPAPEPEAPEAAGAAQ